MRSHKYHFIALSLIIVFQHLLTAFRPPVTYPEIASAPVKPVTLYDLMTRHDPIPDSLLHGLRLLGSTQGCIEHDGTDHSQIHSNLPNGIEDAACDLVSLFPTPLNFRVYDYAMYPMLAIVDQEQGHEIAFNAMREQVEAVTPNYLLIAVQVTPSSPPLSSASAKIKVALKLPLGFEGINAALNDAIQYEVQKIVDESYNGQLLSLPNAETAGIKHLHKIIQQVLDGTFQNTMSETLLKANGFWAVASDLPLPNIVRTGTVTSSDLVKDYAGLEADGASIYDMAYAAAQTTPYGISVGIILTDNINYQSGTQNKFQEAKTAFDQMPQKMVVWMHYYSPASGAKKIYYKWKFGNTFTEADAGQVLETAHTAYLAGGVAKPNSEPNANKSEMFLDCPDSDHQPSWSDLKWRMRPNVTQCLQAYRNTFPEHCDFNPLCWYGLQGVFVGGAACGFVDGCLDTLGGIYELAKGLAVASSHTPFTPIWWLAAMKTCVEEESFWKGIQKKYKDDVNYWEGAYNAFKGLLNKFDIDGMIQAISNAFDSWFKGITFQRGPVDAGYEAGKIAFEIIMTVLTGGTAQLQKIQKITKEALDQFMAAAKKGPWGMKDYAQKSIGNPVVSAADKARCLSKFGCFVGVTLITTAAGQTPIAELFRIQYSNSLEPTKYAINTLNGFALSYHHDGSKTSNHSAWSSALPYELEEITPETHQWAKLELTNDNGNGGIVNIKMLRPNWWFQQNHAEKVGDIIRLQMSEMNISGNAKILSFNPCTIDTRCLNFTTEKGPNYVYRPITGYFEREVPEVWDYVFSSGDTIGATANHPFFSQDRLEYFPVGDLGLGERIKLAGERTAVLSSKVKRENGAEKVYNLEVWREHNFHVGSEGVLVHNNYVEEYVRRVSGNPDWKFHKPKDLFQGTKPGCSNCVQYTIHNGKKIYFDDNDFPVFEEFAGKGNINGEVIRYDSPDLQGYKDGLPQNIDVNYAQVWLNSVKNQYGNDIFIIPNSTQVKINGILHSWHHHQNGTTMFLVPSSVHTVAHTGGGALIKYGLKYGFDDPTF